MVIAKLNAINEAVETLEIAQASESNTAKIRQLQAALLRARLEQNKSMQQVSEEMLKFNSRLATAFQGVSDCKGLKTDKQLWWESRLRGTCFAFLLC